MNVMVAARGLLLALLLSLPALRGDDDWAVIYKHRKVHALRGSAVYIDCDIIYPNTNTVNKTLWFTKTDGDTAVDLKSDPDYTGRVKHGCSHRSNRRCTSNTCYSVCSLGIADVRESDAAEYKFRFITNQPDGEYTGTPGVMLSVTTGLQGDDDWAVTYRRSEVCAVRGSRVHMYYIYKYPNILKDVKTTVNKTLWFTKTHGDAAVDLESDSNYRRYHYCWSTICTSNTCYRYCCLRIDDVRESDSAEYKFRIITNQPDGEYTGTPGLMLSVTADPDVQVQVTSSTSNGVKLGCYSICYEYRLPGFPTYIWYKNGQYLRKDTPIIVDIEPADNYSCAVEGYERFPSALVYAPKRPSVTVSPSGEIEEGTSVTLSCSSDANPPASYTWFKENENSPKGSGQNFTITNITSELGGNYSCEARNVIGGHKVTFPLTVVTGADITPPAPAPPKDECCPSGWMERTGRCFYLSNHTLNWREARSTCQDLGGDLAVMLSRDDQAFLTNLVKLLYHKDPNVLAAWIGLEDFKQEGRFIWVNGHPLKKELAFWRPGEPNNVTADWDEMRRDQDCVAISPPFDVINNWDDVICVRSLHFLCEITAHTEDHTDGCEAI